jgi:hypothetical protein
MRFRHSPVLLVFATISLTAAFAASGQDDATARIAEIQRRLTAVEARATAVDDINEIENLQRTFGYYFDKMLWDNVADLFADDGTIELGFSGVYAGKERIRAYLFSLSDGRQGPLEGVLNNFVQLQPIITLSDDGQTAQGRWRALVMTGVSGSGSGGNWGEGPYENTYVRQDGTWKIQSLRWYGRFVAPYEGGWIEVDEQALRDLTVSPTLEPDAPPGSDNAPFPAASVPAFHFDNPGR